MNRLFTGMMRVDSKALFQQMCGGTDQLSGEFPRLNSALDRAGILADELEMGIEDVLYIDYAAYDQKQGKLFLRITVSLKEVAAVVMTDVDIMTKAGEKLGCIQYTADHTSWDSRKFETKVDAGALKDPVILIDARTSWMEQQSGRVGAMEIKDEYVLSFHTYVKDIILEDPRHIKTKEDDAIRISYGRASMVKEEIDYEYPCKLEKEGQELYLCCKGDVKLEAGKKFSEIYRYNLLVDSYSGVAVYNNESGFSAEKTEEGFHWEFDKVWNRIVPARRLPFRDPVIFRLRIEFYCEGEKDLDSILVSSDLDIEGQKNEKKISLLKMLWGCVAKGTEIRMADGGHKKVEDIRPGDVIAGKDGRSMPVKDIMTGHEDSIWVVEAGDGHKICVTSGHPFVTEENGTVKTAELTACDRLLMEDGGYQPLRFLYEIPYHDKVYSLVTGEDDAFMICNGFVTGDFDVQNKAMPLMQRNAAVLEMEDDALEQELEKLKEYRDSLTDSRWKHAEE